MKGSAIPAKGAKLFIGDREIGWVSSATHSPQLNSPIALGFPLRDFSNPETVLAVEVDGTRHDATIRALPFYRHT
jgi:glycine cleavage system aminomethyltransferase T